jgi:N-acetyl-gamma-glutamyl-phosphate/LysW-gamma-L-alpha-aminoadipyl-6-phosphate reductase
MDQSMRVGIVGASGYVGGEIFRILVNHPGVRVTIATSKQYEGEVIHRVHPNLRSFTDLKFVTPNIDSLTSNCDFVFTAVPHGSAVKIVPELEKTGLKIVDMSADFRLRDVEAYEHWYKFKHPYPEMLQTTPLGIPELYHGEIKKSKLVANPGCMAITSILALAPIARAGLIDLDHIVVDTKIGSSGGGTKPSIGTHHGRDMA